MPWNNEQGLPPKSFTCWNCEKLVGSNTGYQFQNSEQRIYICNYCLRPNYFEGAKQIPSPVFGNKVPNLPTDIEQLYAQARSSTGVNAYTATVLVCRKLLMNIAVSKGAEANKSFADYVDYLSNKGFVPPDSKEWVDHIRTKGNEANHEIVLMKKEEAEELLEFIEMLLKIIYEFPARMKAKKI